MSYSTIIVCTIFLSELLSLSAFLPHQQGFHHISSTISNQKITGTIQPLSALSPFLLSDVADNTPAAFEDAFNDDIVLVDSTIQLLLAGFGVFVILAVAAKFFLNKMDEAIEKVLVEFESTMKRKYASRWVSIAAKLEGLDEPERSQKLFAIMEQLQETEPQFMAKVNGNSQG